MWAHCLNCIEIPRKKKNTDSELKGTLKLADDTKMGGAVNSSKALQRDPNKEIRGLDNHQMY